uniref:Protein kinase domain-containing protein n=1 Tax=Heterorhabditis bacteriophora TaxID=37862 RepID=A0A1I7X5X2_HETBA
MVLRLHRNEDRVSQQLLQWICERVPADDPIRITSLSGYKEIQELGKGRFGEVIKYMNTAMVHVTAKRVKIEMFDHWSQDTRRVSHVSICYSSCHQMLVFTEFLPNGSVKDKIMKDTITEETAVKYFLDWIFAAANLLITISDSIKLANFGLVRDLAVDGFGIAVASEISLDFRGTLLYVAPEVLTSELGPGNRKAYVLPSDIWALGCTLIEMLCKYPPHFEYFGHVDEIQREIVDRASGGEESIGDNFFAQLLNILQWLPYNAEVLVPTCSRAVKLIVDAIFERNPALRPTTCRLKAMANSILGEHFKTRFSFECPPSTSNGPISLENNEKDMNETKNKNRCDRTEKQEYSENMKYFPLETLENGVLRRKRIIHVKKRRKATSFEKICSASILTKSVLYVLIFIVLGLGTLSFFLFVSYCIVLFFRYLIKLQCDCDLSQPQYLIISGILLILLFALLFSCCMVALGEYKFRMANKSLRKSRFFVARPSKDVIFCGVTILRSKTAASSVEEEKEDDEEAIELPEIPLRKPKQEDQSFYYR